MQIISSWKLFDFKISVRELRKSNSKDFSIHLPDGDLDKLAEKIYRFLQSEPEELSTNIFIHANQPNNSHEIVVQDNNMDRSRCKRFPFHQFSSEEICNCIHKYICGDNYVYED